MTTALEENRRDPGRGGISIEKQEGTAAVSHV
jgi:hypothetical protein